jgi:hypothetical protein
MALAHHAARQKDQQINRKISQNHQCDRAPREHSRAEWDGVQHFGECSLIDVVGLKERVIVGTRSICRHTSAPAAWLRKRKCFRCHADADARARIRNICRLSRWYLTQIKTHTLL